MRYWSQRFTRRAPLITAFVSLLSCDDQSETVVNGLHEPCVSLSSLTPMSTTVSVGDSARFSVHPVYSAACAHVNREIRWEVRDSTVARIGVPSDTSVYVTGMRAGQTILTARAVADEYAVAASNLTIVAR